MTQGANGRSTGLRRVADSGAGGEAQPGGERRALSADDALPPVEPPSAGFIIKLFVVPAVIVAVVIGVVLCFQWVAQTEVDVKSLLDAIDHNANNSWQCAHDLAKLLHSDENLRTDATAATRLSGMLSARIKSGPPKGEAADDIRQEVGVRVYLCKALGEFATPAALAGLIEAARPPTGETGQTDQKLATAVRDGQFAIRKAALEGLAVLAYNSGQRGSPIATAEVLPLLLVASREVGPGGERAIRERAAFALGVLGGDEAVARLVEMLSDIHSNVRFNAATGLARQGDARGLDVLREMIDPSESVATVADAEPVGPDGKPLSEQAIASLRAEMEAVIRLDGLAAVEKLAQSATNADLTKVAPAVAALRNHADAPPVVKNKAQEVQNLLKQRAGR